jgi:adenylate cyclase
MIVGNMGTTQKIEYTVMDNQITARIADANKLYGTWILASRDTIKSAGEKIIGRRLDRVRIFPGKGQPVRLYEIMGIKGEAPPHLIDQRDLFEEALGLFEKRRWKAALKAFQNTFAFSRKYSSGDEPSKRYIRRCIRFLKSPPPDKWHGLYTLG